MWTPSTSSCNVGRPPRVARFSCTGEGVFSISTASSDSTSSFISLPVDSTCRSRLTGTAT